MTWPVAASRLATVGSASTTVRTSAAMLSRSAFGVARAVDADQPVQPEIGVSGLGDGRNVGGDFDALPASHRQHPELSRLNQRKHGRVG